MEGSGIPARAAGRQQVLLNHLRPVWTVSRLLRLCTLPFSALRKTLSARNPGGAGGQHRGGS